MKTGSDMGGFAGAGLREGFRRPVHLLSLALMVPAAMALEQGWAAILAWAKPATAARPFAGAVYLGIGPLQIVVGLLMYGSLRLVLKRPLVAGWLVYVVGGYLATAGALRAVAVSFPVHHPLGYGLALLAAALSVMGTCIAFQQLNLSLPEIRRCRTVAELALRAASLTFVVQGLLELASVWYSVTTPHAPARVFAAAFTAHSVASLVISVCLVAAIRCGGMSSPIYRTTSKLLP